MKPDEVVTLTAIAQVILAVAALIGSIAVSLFVYYGTKQTSRLEYDRAIREWWNALDQIALSSDDMLTIADQLMDPASYSQSTEQRRRKWFAFIVLNALASTYIGAKLGLVRSTEDSVGIIKHHLRRLLVSDDIFSLSQAGYEPDFMALCRQVRDELTNQGLTEPAAGIPHPA